MTSEGPHHPGQEPDEVSPGAGGSPPYGDRSAQQTNGYGPGTPDLGWAPPPPAARPNSPAPAWGAPGEAPPTVGWKAPDSSPPGPWGPPGGQPQRGQWNAQGEQPGQWGPPGEQPQPQWGGPGEQPGQWGAPGEQPQPGTWNPQADQQPQPGAWNPQADQQQPTTAWAAASVPQQPPAWPQAGDSVPQAGPQPPAWGQGGPPQQSWPEQDDQSQPGRTPQQPAAWGPAGEQPRAAAWGPAETPGRGNPPEQDDQQPGGWNPTPGQQSAVWGPQDDQPAPAWGGQDDHQQPAGWGTAPAPQAGPESAAWGSAAAPQAGNREPSAWGSAAAPQAGGQEPPAWGAAAAPQAGGHDQAGPWGAANDREHAPTAAWAGSAPQQTEQPQSNWDTPAEQPRPADTWPPAEPAAAPAARATASVGRADPAAWGAAAARPGDDARPARPAVPEGEPWSADEAWGTNGPEQAPAEPAGAGWEQSRAENAPRYQPAPGPGISPANAVPLPPTEARIPGASLAAALPADYPPAGQYADPAGQDGGQSGYDADQPGDGWGGDAPQAARQAGAAPAIPQPRTSPEGASGEPGGSVSASASVPLSSRVMPPTDQALRPGALPAPQPRVYGRPSRSEDGPGQDEQGGHQPEPHRFQPDAEPGGRFDGGPEPRFAGGPDDRFGDGPGGRFDGSPAGGYDGGPAGRFDGGPATRFDDRDQQHDRPGNFGDGPGGFGEGPGGFRDGPGAGNAPVPQGALPAFPPSMPPAFADPSSNQRPANGTKPHSEPARPGDRFGGAAAPVSGGPLPGHGPMDPPGGNYPPGFPPAGNQPERPLWDLGETPENDQGRFDAFKPEPETAKPAEPPTPKVRNGRVLMAVLTAAVLILVVPLGALWLLGKIGGSDDAPAFDPAVGSCVKQSGTGAVAAGCGDEGAFKVVSKVDAKEKCTDPGQPHVVLPGQAPTRVLCLGPATTG